MTELTVERWCGRTDRHMVHGQCDGFGWDRGVRSRTHLNELFAESARQRDIRDAEEQARREMSWPAASGGEQ
jgi:hypothetical protein